MTDRDKLIELISVYDYIHVSAEGNKYSIALDLNVLADHLLANGVAVNNWRDAKTDPPPQDEDVLLCFSTGTMVVGGLREDGGWYSNTDAEWYTDCETTPEKWQQLPKPLKEETK